MQVSAFLGKDFAEQVDLIIDRALEEDLGNIGDVTSKAVVGHGVGVQAEIFVKSPGTVAGLKVAEKVFKHLNGSIAFTPLVKDGDYADTGTRIALVSGDALAILGAERTALNFLQHLSGIATETAKYKRAIEGYGVELLDTRKTTPGLRLLEKYAVLAGGAVNHRFGLYDQILIKDNHIKVAGDIDKAVKQARKSYPNLKVEVEAETLDEVKAALEAKADIILLDNMDTKMLKEAVAIIGDKAIKEASGGIILANITEVAATGVDRISTSAITQAAKPLDISMEVICE